MNYKAITKSAFGCGRYKAITIREQDMEQIRNWRNEQMVVLRQKEELSPEMQNKYFNTVVKKLFTDHEPLQLLFSLLFDDVLIGYGGLVHISWQDERAELSFLVNPRIAADQTQYKSAMSAFISMMKELTFDEMKFNRLFTETYDFREFHISVLVENGFVEEGRMREHIKEAGQYCDSLIHGILKKDYDKS